jgi:hypothetical protein
VNPELVRSTTDERSTDASPLEGFWASDIWLMRTCPLGVGHGIMRFGGLTRQLSHELKLAVRAKLMASEWSLQTEQAFLVNRIVVWLATRHSATTSLLDRPLERWMVALQGYLLEQGFLRQPMRRQLSRVQEETRTPLRDPAIVMLRSLYAKQLVLLRPAPVVPEFTKDVWDARRMGVVTSLLRSDYCLSFVKLSQPWLRLATKHFIRHTLVTTSYSDARGKLLALKRFSDYLAQLPPGITPEVIDRPLIVAYEAHLRTLGVAPATIGLWLVALRSFFELCAREGWAAVPERPLIYREDFPRHVRRLPRFIAEDVLQQLNAHLDATPHVPQYDPRTRRVRSAHRRTVHAQAGLPLPRPRRRLLPGLLPAQDAEGAPDPHFARTGVSYPGATVRGAPQVEWQRNLALP